MKNSCFGGLRQNKPIRGNHGLDSNLKWLRNPAHLYKNDTINKIIKPVGYRSQSPNGADVY